VKQGSLLERKQSDANDLAGFTLIEVLVVMVVLGLLAAIVVFEIGGVAEASRVSACRSDSRTVTLAVQAAKTENPSTYPSATYTWEVDLLPGSLLTDAPFLRQWPSTDAGYQISVAGAGQPATSDNTAPKNGDVLVQVGTTTFDFTTDPSNACSAV
jgi:prepilin-type N-terminal cleavage/methylation domain-containing protein